MAANSNTAAQGRRGCRLAIVPAVLRLGIAVVVLVSAIAIAWDDNDELPVVLLRLGLLDLILWLSDPTNHTFEAGWAPQPRDLLGGRKVGIERRHALQKQAGMVAVRRRKRKARLYLDSGERGGNFLLSPATTKLLKNNYFSYLLYWVTSEIVLNYFSAKI